MITNCRQCHRPYWRYWRSELPSDVVCSLPCYDERKHHRGDGPAEFPGVITRRIREHLSLAHNTRLPGFYDGCETCEWLNEQLADSTSFYLDRAEVRECHTK